MFRRPVTLTSALFIGTYYIKLDHTVVQPEARELGAVQEIHE